MTSSDLSQKAGFEEIEHTADWAYRIWAESLAELFMQAASGLYYLADAQLISGQRLEREIHLQGIDRESLLVAWLNELLHFHNSENLGFDHFEIQQLDKQTLKAKVTGAAIQQWVKDIKAVTYHNLAIDSTATGFEVTIVLDV